MSTPLTFHSDGLTLHADSFGDPAERGVLFLHGGGQTRQSWHGASQILADRGWHVISLDQRGHGDSDWSARGEYDFSYYARDIWNVVGAFKEPPAIVGASLGGMAALLAVGEAEDQRAVASSLVLVDVAPHVDPEGVERVRNFMLTAADGFASLEEASEAIAAYTHRPPPKNVNGLRKNLRLRANGRWCWHWDPQFIAREGEQSRVQQNLPRMEEAARALTVPTLLVRGQSSDMLTEDGVRKMQDLVSHLEFVEIAGAGHMVTGDQNDVFAAAIIDFIDRSSVCAELLL